MDTHHAKKSTDTKQPFSPMRQESQRRRRSSSVSEYKKSLLEKQELKKLYGLREYQLKRYVKETLTNMQKVENLSEELMGRLEKRLDNVVFRMGFAKSRKHARQLVSHAYFLVNGQPVNIASFQVKKGDMVTLKEIKKKKAMLKDLAPTIQKAQAPLWLKVNVEKLQAETVGDPTLDEANPPVQIPLIFEFYSR